MYLSVRRQLFCEYIPTNRKKTAWALQGSTSVYKQLRIDLVLLWIQYFAGYIRTTVTRIENQLAFIKKVFWVKNYSLCIWW